MRRFASLITGISSSVPAACVLFTILLSGIVLPVPANSVQAADEAAKPLRPQLQILNGSSQQIDIFWLKSETERIPNGSVAPGKDTVISTTLGHRFAIVGRDDKAEITVTSQVPVQGFRFDPECDHGAPKFYTQSASANGLPVVASKNVSPYALKEAVYLINMMLAQRPDVRDAMVKSGARLCILAHNEFTTDLPEFARMAEGQAPDKNLKRFPARDFWDARARGTGGSETDPYCSCGEENLLGYAGDPYSTECILIHEIAHNIHLRGLQNVDPTFDARLRTAYRQAMDAGLWAGKYASVNHHEYFAEGVQSWFDNNRENDHDHNHVNTRVELIEYDPGLADLCREVFGDTELKYTKPATRLKDHLEGYDPKTAPRFVWPDRLTEVKLAIRRGAEARSQAASTPPKAAAADPILTIDRIFQSDEFKEEKLGTLVWSKRTDSYFTLEATAPVLKENEKSPKDKKNSRRDLVRIDAASGNREIVVPADSFVPAGAKEPLAVDAFEFSDDESKLLIFTNSQRVWRRNTRGDYWLLDVLMRELKKLGGDADPASMLFAKFSPDGSRIAYVRKNNLYVQDLKDFQITALTADGSVQLINGTGDWVNEEELDIRDGFRWSPDGKSVAFWQFDTTGVAEFVLVDNTSGTHSRTTAFAYPKVGGQNSATRIGVVEATGGPVRWLDLPGDPRNHYVARVEWTPDSQKILLQQFNRLQNVNRVMLADPRTGMAQTIHTETDDAWIENENPVRWLNDGRNFVWLSERDGWRHAYLGATEAKPMARITSGELDLLRIEAVDEKAGKLYYSASPDNATQSYLYHTGISGGPTERLTPSDQPGYHTYQFSPNSNYAVHTYSTLITPPRIELIRMTDHSVVRPLVTNKSLQTALAQLKLPQTEFLRLEIGDNVVLDAWCMKPVQVDAAQKHPLLMYVYGEPHGQTVRDAWQGTRGLWHTMLAQQGCMVASIDNRGTLSPRGREWRKCVYRQIGVLASKEQAAATRDLLRRYPFLDEGRVGVWGWSGGGSMSLNCIFRHPDLYRTAISIAPVADQKLYDTIYQERYMGLPDDNSEGYRNGSPLTHAGQLQGNLLLVHGTGDDNCHYQGTEKLMNELIAGNKSFSVMPYPGRSHSISEGRNTTRHLYGLLTGYLQQHLMSPKSIKTPTTERTAGGENKSVKESFDAELSPQ
jgi:dipeptidyl-peptidase-4